MQNVWVLAIWLFTRRPGKGRHELIPSLLRFVLFRQILMRAIERFYHPTRCLCFCFTQSMIH